jgi:hypothetical protein
MPKENGSSPAEPASECAHSRAPQAIHSSQYSVVDLCFGLAMLSEDIVTNTQVE